MILPMPARGPAFFVCPAGRTYLEVEVLYLSGPVKSHMFNRESVSW